MSLSIGIVGGMSPESTATYYQRIVHRHQREFHDHSYPRIIIASVSFQQYIAWQHEDDWTHIARGLEDELRAVASAGADFALLATNTMHKVLPSIKSPVPILSILDSVGRYARINGLKSLGLTGTKFTMSRGFYSQGLERQGLTVLTPSLSDQETVHRIIYDELILGNVNPISVASFSEIVQRLIGRGAEAILLGCTELGLLTTASPNELLCLDSTRIHADAAWEIAIGKISL